MDEAKTLVHMSISSIFAAMFLAAAVGLISIGYMFWSYFSRQEAANARMSQYANYTAFDNTTIRGQEVLGLIESDLDLFVIFCDGTGTSSSIDDMGVSKPLFVYYDDIVGVKDFEFDSIVSTENVNTTCKNSLIKLKSLGAITPESMVSGNNMSLNDKTHNELITFLTTSSTGMGAKKLDNTCNLFETNSYAAFKSTLVYAEDGTTDIVGVILVRAHENVQF